MQSAEQKVNLLDFDRKGMESFFEGLGAKPLTAAMCSNGFISTASPISMP